MIGHIKYLWEGLLTWIIVGSLAGYFMGFFGARVNEGKSVLVDMIAGIIGALIGGFAAHYFIIGRTGLLVSIAVAAISACGLTYALRAMRRPRMG